MGNGRLLKKRFYRVGLPCPASVRGHGSGDLPGQPEHAGQDAAEPEETDLAVREAQYLAEHTTPAARRDEGEQALDDKDEGHRQPKDVAVHQGCPSRTHGITDPERPRTLMPSYFLGAALLPPPRKTLKNSEPLGSRTITSLLFVKLAL